MGNSRLKFARMKGVTSTAAQEKALGIEKTETLPDISQDEIISIKHRLGRRGERP